MAKKIKCPIWLDEVALAEWKVMVKLLEKENVDFTPKDVKALEAYCENYSTWLEYTKYLKKHGRKIKSPNGYEQIRPEVTIANTAESNMRHWMKELLITPASRSKVKVVSNGVIKDKDELEMEGLVSK